MSVQHCRPGSVTPARPPRRRREMAPAAIRCRCLVAAALLLLTGPGFAFAGAEESQLGTQPSARDWERHLQLPEASRSPAPPSDLDDEEESRGLGLGSQFPAQQRTTEPAAVRRPAGTHPAQRPPKAATAAVHGGTGGGADAGGGKASANILFAYDSAELAPGAEQQLGVLAAALNGGTLAGNRFLIEGHTDAVGSDAYNLRLSQQRAEAVVGFLVATGVDPARLDAVGRGESDLVDPRHPEAADNRRVAVVNLGAR